MNALRERIDEAVPKGKIVVAGFYAYPMWYYGVAAERMIRTLDFSGQVLRGVRGPFYLLVPKPTGMALAEDVHVKFPVLYDRYNIETPLVDYRLDKDIGQWRIYKLADKW